MSFVLKALGLIPRNGIKYSRTRQMSPQSSMAPTPGGPILFKVYEEGWVIANQEGWYLHEVPALGKLKEEDLKLPGLQRLCRPPILKTIPFKIAFNPEKVLE